MAGANYEVNISLNSRQAEQQLKALEGKLKSFNDAVAGKGRGGSRPGRMAAENINALNRAVEKRFQLSQKINRLEQQGVKTAKLRKDLGQLTEAQAKRQFGTFKQLEAKLSRSIRLEQARLRLQKDQTREIDKQARIRGPVSPIGGNVNIPGSPAQIAASARAGGRRSPIRGAANIPGSPLGLAARNKAIGKRTTDFALGAGFPLLFGGGPGAVLGGAAGGLTGGGLGAQIAFSALGQQLDRVVGSAINLGKALSDVNPDITRLAEAAGFAGTETAMLLEKIEQYGDKAQAAQLATKLLATQIGQNGVTALKTFGDDAVKLGNALSVIFSQVLANIAKAAGPLLQGLAKFASEGALIGGFKARKGGLTGPEQLAQDILEQGAFTGGGSGLVGDLAESSLRQRAAALNIVGLDVRSDKAMREFARSTAVASQRKFQQPVLKEIETVAGGVQTSKEASAAKAAARRLQASQQRIALLDVETQKQKDITVFKNRIAQLELDGDKMSATRLQGEQRLLDIAAQKERAILRISKELPFQQQLAEQTAINEKFAAQEAEARAQTERELNVLQRDRDQQHMDALKQHIEMQYELNTAVQQQLQLADSISQVMGQGMTRAFDLLIDGAQNWGMALRDIAANVLRDIARQLIQIYVIEQAIGFMRNLMTPFDFSTPLGAGGGTVGNYGTFGPNYGIRQRAKGGSVSANTPYLVGERGPELFVPGAQGNIVPNHAMGGGVGNIVVNVDASGSSVEGNVNEQKQLGEAIGVAIRQELIKQKRPGGLLA